MSRVRQISLNPEMRQKIVDNALARLGGEARKIAAEVASVQQRLNRVQTEINNLVNVLKVSGATALAAVADELNRLEEEKNRLRNELDALQNLRAPMSAEEEKARILIDGWRGIPELLEDATLEERRVVLQHAIQAIELRAAENSDGKKGTYALSIFPEFGTPGISISATEPTDPPKGGTETDLLTANTLVREVEEKAPRVGLEPTTQRLTAACSTD